MADTATPRPAAPTSGGAVRFCWTSIDRWGRSRTMSIRAKDCPDPAKAREAIEAMLDTDVRVEAAR